jgi:hypothetical protein
VRELAIQLHARDVRGAPKELLLLHENLIHRARGLRQANEDCTCSHHETDHTVGGCWANGAGDLADCACAHRTGLSLTQRREYVVSQLFSATVPASDF